MTKQIQEHINNNDLYSIHTKQATKRARGRPKGGTAWIISKEFVQAKVTFVNERISYAQIENLVVIGVYMCFNDGKNETHLEYESDLQEIISIYNQKTANKEVIIFGDFNSDIRRNGKLDVTFKNFIEQNKLTCYEEL